MSYEIMEGKSVLLIRPQMRDVLAFGLDGPEERGGHYNLFEVKDWDEPILGRFQETPLEHKAILGIRASVITLDLTARRALVEEPLEWIESSTSGSWSVGLVRETNTRHIRYQFSFETHQNAVEFMLRWG